MPSLITSACVAILLLCNLFAGILLALVFWLNSAWMIGDGQAMILSEFGWFAIAAKRAIFGMTCALVFGLIFAVVNRFAYARIFPGKNLLPWSVAGAPGWLIALGVLVGSIQFFVEKPFM